MEGPAEQPDPGFDLEAADAYGRSFGDVYDRWYEGVTDAEATADFVAACHPDRSRPVLELGVGTGRLAGPLTRRGLDVVGLDGSAAMLARCPRSSAFPGDGGPEGDRSGSLRLVRADMRALPFAPGAGPGRGPFGSVLLAFNTLFNLVTEADQAALLAALARLVGPDGPVVVEMLDARPLADGPLRSVGRRGRQVDPLVVTATVVDPEGQRVWGRHVEIGDAGLTLRPWTLRWVTPGQLDAMATAAGLELAERRGSWDEPTGTEPAVTASAGTDRSATVVSVYRARLGP